MPKAGRNAEMKALLRDWGLRPGGAGRTWEPLPKVPEGTPTIGAPPPLSTMGEREFFSEPRTLEEFKEWEHYQREQPGWWDKPRLEKFMDLVGVATDLADLPATGTAAIITPSMTSPKLWGKLGASAEEIVEALRSPGQIRRELQSDPRYLRKLAEEIADTARAAFNRGDTAQARASMEAAQNIKKAAVENAPIPWRSRQHLTKRISEDILARKGADAYERELMKKVAERYKQFEPRTPIRRRYVEEVSPPDRPGERYNLLERVGEEGDVLASALRGTEPTGLGAWAGRYMETFGSPNVAGVWELAEEAGGAPMTFKRSINPLTHEVQHTRGKPFGVGEAMRKDLRWSAGQRNPLPVQREVGTPGTYPGTQPSFLTEHTYHGRAATPEYREYYLEAKPEGVPEENWLARHIGEEDQAYFLEDMLKGERNPFVARLERDLARGSQTPAEEAELAARMRRWLDFRRQNPRKARYRDPEVERLEREVRKKLKRRQKGRVEPEVAEEVFERLSALEHFPQLSGGGGRMGQFPASQGWLDLLMERMRR